jgi:hypothetical protein
MTASSGKNKRKQSIDSRKGAKRAKFGEDEINTFYRYFPTFAALAPLREIIRAQGNRKKD